MKIDFEVAPGLALPQDWSEAVPFTLTADCCAVAEALPVPCAVHLLITDDKRIRTVNREHRGMDSSTDVLSFPTVSYEKRQTAHTAARALKREFDAELNACFLGDILISWEHAAEQAKEYGHSLQRELCYLLAHGIFHLCGYDHMQPSDQKEMRIMEEKSLQMAGVAREAQSVAQLTDEELLALAREAMQRSYSPYSRYKVGACLLSADGRLFEGCNVENASFGLTNCAERTAIFKAVSEGVKEFAAIAIASESSPPWPCGACRQVLNEFAPDIRVLVTWGHGESAQSTLRELLPHGFGPSDLK